MQKGVSAVADKFRLMMDNNAKSKEEIQEELNRMIELKKDRKSTRLNSSHIEESRMPSSA